MSNQRFGNFGNNNDDLPDEFEINVPDSPTHRTPPRTNQRVSRGFIIGTLGVILVLCIGFTGFIFRDQIVASFSSGDTAAQEQSPGQTGDTSQSNQPSVSQPDNDFGSPVIVGSNQEGFSCTSENTLTIAFDSFGSYFTAIDVAENLGADSEQTYCIRLIPFGFDGDGGVYDYNEEQRAQAMCSGEFDVLFTTEYEPSRRDYCGKIVTQVDQSAGADMIIAWNVAANGQEINLFNDVQGLTLTYSEGSVNHGALLQMLRFVNLTPDQVNMMPADSVEDAMVNFESHQADVVAAWQPNVLQGLYEYEVFEDGWVEYYFDQPKNSKVLVSSDWWRNISDVIMFSDIAIANKRQALVEFLDDYFVSLRNQQDNPEAVANTIANWVFDGEETNDWTYIYPETAYDDLVLWNEVIAQADYANNYVKFTNPQLQYESLMTNCETWLWGGVIDSCAGFDPADLIDSSFILNDLSVNTNKYASNGQFINPSFQPTTPEVSAMSPEALIELPTIATLPQCSSVEFVRDRDDLLTVEGQLALTECTEALREAFSNSQIQIVIIGSSAWPCGVGQEAVERTAQGRAATIFNYLVNDLGVDPRRITSSYQIPPPEHICAEESILATYRVTIIEVKLEGYGR